MAEEREGSGLSPEEVAARLSLECPFGPSFFLTQLRGFVRDRCPDPRDQLPAVYLHLGDGEVLDVCHVIGLAPRWLALAVHDAEAGHPGAMRTELVPYEIIQRVMVRAVRRAGAHLGFDQSRTPPVFAGADTLRSPEEALRAAATSKPVAGRKPAPGGREGRR